MSNPRTQQDWQAMAGTLSIRTQAFIDGKYVDAASGKTFDCVSPIDGRVLGQVADGQEEDINRAVAAARRSFDAGAWSNARPTHRKKVLLKLTQLIEQHADELALLESLDMGKPVSDARSVDLAATIRCMGWTAEALDKVYGEVAATGQDELGLVTREPLGVIGAIVPWNFPLMIGAWKIAPALAMGNSVVLKPAETASLTLLKLAALTLEAGVPPGVFNVVTGPGRVTGEALALSGDVDVLVFTGSGATGRRLLQYSAQSNLKRCYLELGGKSPNIVFADAPDLKAAAKVAATAIFRNAGQVCVAGSRLLVQQEVHDEFVSILAETTRKMVVGNPLSLATQVGAVNSLAQLEGNLGFVADATREGGQVVTGGARILQETGGWYMDPTVVTGVQPGHRLYREEVFGPVLAVTPFRDEEDALRLANASDFGLASGVWTANLSRAHRMIRGIRAGVVHVNTYGGADGTVPLAGTRQSGNGADKSLHALDKYCDLKTAWIQL